MTEETQSAPPAQISGLQKLRIPFAPHQIGKLPKPYKKDADKGNCEVCGGYHGLPAMHLDYVGHAALTDRMLDVDPEWTWEPLALGADGLPMVDKDGGMWIRLTICGVTRLGYGDAQGKTGANATKERIGDALRNAGMRFGLALDLWHKGDLHGGDADLEDDKKIKTPDKGPPISDAQLSELRDLLAAGEIPEADVCMRGGIKTLAEMPVEAYPLAKSWAKKQIEKKRKAA